MHGAESVVLSGGYEDDVDNGEEVTYTGCGGFVKRVQVMNQTQENPSNAALCTSISTKVPVRVVRGFSLKSAYAPVEGYRYDGLYIVTSMWKERRRKLVVLRFHLERLEGQPPIPVREKISRKRNLPKTRENVRQQRVPQPKNKLKRKNPTSLRSATFPSDFAVPYPIISPSFVAPVSMDVFREPIWL
uniref:YDG domain-containing protein n=1 Tax=Arcella intermedia TaxID=1963864 RepID=A0A6B2LHI2_9EUKA